jgi:hypothetical protein
LFAGVCINVFGTLRDDGAERRVVAFGNDNNHLATLAGYELAPHRVAAVMERWDAIARAAKATGDERRMDQLRADAYLDLLAGTGLASGGPISDGPVGDGRVGDGGAGAAAGSVPWPEAPADPELAEPDPAPAAPEVDPAGAVDLWAFGVPEPPAETAGYEVVDAVQVARQARWLDGFELLPTSPTCPACGEGAGAVGGSEAGSAPRCELVQVSSGGFVWSTPANLQYLSTPDRPLIDDQDLAQLLAGPCSTDADAVDQYLVTAHLADPDLTPAEGILDPGG